MFSLRVLFFWIWLNKRTIKTNLVKIGYNAGSVSEWKMADVFNNIFAFGFNQNINFVNRVSQILSWQKKIFNNFDCKSKHVLN
jgi:hypothetical protein